MKLFRIAEVLVDDKHLGELLRRMAGVVKQMDLPEPVVEKSIRIRNGSVQAGDAQSIVDLFAAEVMKSRPKRLVAVDIKNFLAANGRQVTAYSYLLKQAQERGLLRKHGTGSGTYYEVRTPKPPRAAKKQKGAE